MRKVFIALVIFFIMNKGFAVTSDDYAAFAEQQKATKSQVTAPYLADVAAINTSVTARMHQPDFQAMMATVLDTKKSAINALVPNQPAAAMSSPVVIFVSFSMPSESLKLWLEQAKKMGAKVVLRGLVNNSFKQTTQAVSELVGKNVVGLQIDPTLFHRFAITKVPAVVISASVACPDNISCSPDFDVIYGNISLDYALEKLAKANTVRAVIASDSLKKMRS